MNKYLSAMAISVSVMRVTLILCLEVEFVNETRETRGRFSRLTRVSLRQGLRQGDGSRVLSRLINILNYHKNILFHRTYNLLCFPCFIVL